MQLPKKNLISIVKFEFCFKLEKLWLLLVLSFRVKSICRLGGFSVRVQTSLGQQVVNAVLHKP